MERINLTPLNERVLPVTINGRDIDIHINVEDLPLTTFLMDMATVMKDIQDEVARLSESEDIEAIRAVARRALEAVDGFNLRLCELCPEFGSAMGVQKIRDVQVWAQLSFALAELVTEGRARLSAAREIEAGASEVME